MTIVFAIIVLTQSVHVVVAELAEGQHRTITVIQTQNGRIAVVVRVVGILLARHPHIALLQEDAHVAVGVALAADIQGRRGRRICRTLIRELADGGIYQLRLYVRVILDVGRNPDVIGLVHLQQMARGIGYADGIFAINSVLIVAYVCRSQQNGCVVIGTQLVGSGQIGLQSSCLHEVRGS